MAELVDLIDEEDKVVGIIEKQVLLTTNHPRRVVHIFVVNSKHEIYLHRIAQHKQWYPGYWASSAAGFVKAGESYEDAAKRELAEELGITDKPLTHLGKIILDFDDVRRFTGFYLCVHDGPIYPDNREIVEGRFFSRNEAETLMKNGNITPSLPVLYRHFLRTHL
ncbi:NUDIX domain-containing protein [Candidatus Woesearchaeota archaeon]|nr:NUDIX domain-containing protein [Candidatus Woesearchaeota archaeon]